MSNKLIDILRALATQLEKGTYPSAVVDDRGTGPREGIVQVEYPENVRTVFEALAIELHRAIRSYELEPLFQSAQQTECGIKESGRTALDKLIANLGSSSMDLSDVKLGPEVLAALSCDDEEPMVPASIKEKTVSDTFVIGTTDGDAVTKADRVGLSILCSRCDAELGACACPKPGDWLGYRERWVEAEAALQRGKVQQEELTKAALHDFTKMKEKVANLCQEVNMLVQTLGRLLDKPNDGPTRDDAKRWMQHAANTLLNNNPNA
jgi:hypothetical protein